MSKANTVPRGLLTLLLLAALAGCHASEPTTKEPQSRSAMTVTVEPVQQTRMTEELVVTGTVEAWQTLTVSSELSGLKLTSVSAEIGDRVQAGAPLAYLDDRTLRAQLQAAQARYRSAVANVAKTRRPDRPQQINALGAAVEQAKTAVAQEEANLAQLKINQAGAARTAERYNQALKEGYVTALEADQRLTDRNAQLAAIRAAEQRIQGAKFQLKQAQENLRLAQAGGRHEDVAIAQASRDEALATINQLQVQLDQCVIRAPDSGVILTQSAYLGNIVSAGQELFTLARLGRLQLWAEVPQYQLDNLSPGDLIKLESEGHGEHGSVEEIDPKIDPTTRQGRVRISLEPDTEFRIGAFARGKFTGSENDVLVVSAEAVQGQSGEEFVFIHKDDKAHKQPVKLGRREGDKVEVVSGLTLGQDVIVGGAAFLADGDTVQVGNS